jgi:hypothetical protein
MEQLELQWPWKETRAAPRYELEAADRRQLVELVAEAVAAVVRAAREVTDERQNGTEQTH